ncbi:MAG: VOC family protein [Bacteroidota bacterium]|nr:VOC family protein [Bacteroidota bacterium]
MSSINYISAVLFVKDISVSKDFYMNIFKQEIQYDFGTNVMFKSGLTIWELRKDHEIYNCYPNENMERTNKFEIYFETDDLDGIISSVESNSIEKLHEVKEEPWGQRTIRLFDPDGHMVEIAESMVSFVKRLSLLMSPKEVSSKTGLSIEQIEQLIS